MTPGHDRIIELFRVLRAELYLAEQVVERASPGIETLGPMSRRLACERSVKLFCEAFSTTIAEMDVLIGFKDSKSKRGAI